MGNSVDVEQENTSKVTVKLNIHKYEGKLHLNGKSAEYDQKSDFEKVLNKKKGDQRQRVQLWPGIQDPAVGSLIMCFGDKEYLGTATLLKTKNNIGYILTCAHNVVEIDPFNQKPIFADWIIFQRRITEKKGGSFSQHAIKITNINKNNCFVYPYYYNHPTSSSGYDLAIIQCKITHQDIKAMRHQKRPDRLHLSRNARLCSLVKEADYCQVSGYPGEKNGECWGCNGSMKLEKECITYSSIDTSGGQSGSPIYLYGDAHGQSPHIVGVHTGGNEALGKNWGTRFTIEKLKWIGNNINEPLEVKTQYYLNDDWEITHDSAL
eukprot:128521_1